MLEKLYLCAPNTKYGFMSKDINDNDTDGITIHGLCYKNYSFSIIIFA